MIVPQESNQEGDGKEELGFGRRNVAEVPLCVLQVGEEGKICNLFIFFG